jgi:hypothetical protein
MFQVAIQIINIVFNVTGLHYELYAELKLRTEAVVSLLIRMHLAA